MKKFENIMNEYNKIEIPEDVKIRVDKTLNQLPDMKKQNHYGWKRGLVAVLALVFICAFCMANPVAAKQIPIIGSIFTKVENFVPFSGNYQKKQVLPQNEKKLTAKDKGIKITASEVYCDGISIFVTVKVESKKYDFSEMMKLENEKYQSICFVTKYGVNQATGKYDYDIPIYGKNIGQHTFVGMMKFDMDDKDAKEGVVNVHIMETSFDLGKSGDDTIDLKGDWDITVPYKVDTKSSKTIALNEVVSKDIVVKEAMISKQQLVITSKVKGDNFPEYKVYNQDGDRLECQQSYVNEDKEEGRATFSLNGKKVTKVKVHVTSYDDKKLNKQFAIKLKK